MKRLDRLKVQEKGYLILKRYEYREGAFWEPGTRVMVDNSKAAELYNKGIIAKPAWVKEKETATIKQKEKRKK